MSFFGLAGAEPVTPDDSRLPPRVVDAMGCGDGGRILIFQVWTAGTRKVATLDPTSGSDGAILLVGNLRRGKFQHVAYLVESFGELNADGQLEFDLSALFALPLPTVCGVIRHAVRAKTLVWSEHATLNGLHGHMSPSRSLLRAVAEDGRANRGPTAQATGVFPGPNCLAKMRGTPLSGRVRCTRTRRKGQPDRWTLKFARVGDYILLVGGGTDRQPRRFRRLGSAEMHVGSPGDTNPLVDLEMDLDEFVATCVRCGIYRQLWAKRLRRARLRLSELIEEAKACANGDALSRYLLSLERAGSTSAAEIYSVLPRPPPCLRTDIPPDDYEKAFKFDQRWFINRVCSGLTACGQHQLSQAILNKVQSVGAEWVAKAPRRRPSEDKHRGRMREMETLRGKKNPSCSSCTISCAADCVYPLDPRTLPSVGPVEIVVALAEAEAREQKAIDAQMASMELPEE